MISTCCPGCNRPAVNACSAVPPEIPDDRCLLEGDVRRFVGELVLPGRGVLGEGAPADAEHLVAHGEPGDR